MFLKWNICDDIDLHCQRQRTLSVKSRAVERSSSSKTRQRHKLMVSSIPGALSDDDDDDDDEDDGKDTDDLELSDNNLQSPPPDDEKQWPQVARLVLGKNQGLLKQNQQITSLVHLAINIVIKTIHLENPWPERENRAAYRVEILLKAAKKLVKKDKQYKDIILRIQLDPTFCNKVGKWVSHILFGFVIMLTP